MHPETIVFDTRGTMYIMNEHAKLVSLTDVAPKTDDGNVDGSIFTSETTEIADLGVGRPLGGKFDKND